MKPRRKTIQLMQEQIINARPMLSYLQTDKSVLDYLRPALEWRIQEEIFPKAALLRQLIVLEVARLYGNYFSQIVREHLDESWVVETGAHLHIPRKYDKVGNKQGEQVNALFFQGQVLWALGNHYLGRKINISMNSGKVPLDNKNSGAYLDLPSFKTPITLASKKRHPDSPQTLIPATSKEDILRKIEQINMFEKQRLLPEAEHHVASEVLQNFLRVQSSFADQVATTHAMLMDRVLPIKQITLDSEMIGIEYLAHLLEDETSLTYKIFSDPALRTQFIESFAGIIRGWANGDNPFYSIIQKEQGYRLVNYEGSLEPADLAKGLRMRKIFPTVIMKFFAMMVEGGICPSGGWTQITYCTQIKERAVSFLKEYGYRKRAEELKKMPTYIAAVSACFGMQSFQGRLELLDAISVILNPYLYQLKNKVHFSGIQAFFLATPTLYEYIVKQQSPVSYAELKDMLPSMIIHDKTVFANLPFSDVLRYNYEK